MTKALTRDELRARAMQAEIAREPMTITELGGTIYVRGMSAKERDRAEDAYRTTHGGRSGRLNTRDFRAFMAGRVIVDEQGNRLLNDSDVDWLGRLPSGVLDRILTKSTELSGGTDDEIEALGNDSASQAASDDSASSSRSN